MALRQLGTEKPFSHRSVATLPSGRTNQAGGDASGAAAPPDGDGVPEARQQLLHVEVPRDLLQDEAHVGV